MNKETSIHDGEFMMRAAQLTRRAMQFTATVAFVVLLSGCAARSAYRQGEEARQAGDVDQAVAHYRTALQTDPDNATYKIALERAMQAASRVHTDRARTLEGQGELDAARMEYRRASEYDPSNRALAQKVIELDRAIRAAAEANRPSTFDSLRERARAATAPPVLNPSSTEPLTLRFPNTALRDVLDFVGNFAGINVTYDRDVPLDRPVSLQLADVTLEQALDHLMTISQLTYKVLSERSIFVFPDTPAKRIQYDEQVIQTFYISHSDPAELVQILSSLVRFPGLAVQPIIQANKTSNTIVVRGTRPVVEIIERVIAQNDKPRAEIVLDVQILEVNRVRAKNYGLELTEYALGLAYSPTSAPPNVSTAPGSITSPPPINVDQLSASASDFYTAVPAAIVNFLESDTNTKLIAKPQLRGAEGTRLTLKLGDSIPVISTTYTPLATGGAGVNPLSSYTYKDVGVNIDITPRVTAEGDVILDLVLDNSSLGPNVSVAGVSVPSFGQRAVTTRLRLRDGESNLLAGLLREDERTSLTGFPGLVHLPILRQLFSANTADVTQTDIVMLLTPHVIRTNEIKETDLRPITIGSQQNLRLAGAVPELGTDTAVVSDTPVAPAAPPAPAPSAAPSAPSVQGASTISAALPATPIRIGGGPYTVPISIADASRLSTLTLTATFDPALLRVRTVQEGSFMRAGGVQATFTQQAAPGRIDITITRSSDAMGASGSGVLAAIVFDAVAPGAGTLGFSGVATNPNGAPIALQFKPAAISVER